MVRDFGIAETESDIGFYVGILASSFCVAQLFTSLPWGLLSDRIGRRPVLLIGLCGNAVTCALFGLSKTFYYALGLRMLSGLLNGNVAVVKSMLGEITDDSNRGTAFAIWESAFGIGTIVGPVIGGFLVDPAKQFPYLFGNSEFLKTYPYFLPCLVSSIVSVIGAVMGLFYLEETLKPTRVMRRHSLLDIETIPHQVSELEICIPQPLDHIFESSETLLRDSTSLVPDGSDTDNGILRTSQINLDDMEGVQENLSFRKILSKNVCLCIMSYAIWCFLQVIYDEVYALFVATPIALGGLQFSSFEMGAVLSLLGIVQVIGQLILFPIAERKYGLVGSLKLASVTMVIFSILLPFVGDLARHVVTSPDGLYTFTQKAIVFNALLFVLAGRNFGCVIGYIAVMILVNDSAPGKHTLGVVHGFGQVAASLVRSAGPALAGILWTWSLSNNLSFPFDFHFTLFLTAIIACVSFATASFVRHGNDIPTDDNDPSAPLLWDQRENEFQDS